MGITCKYRYKQAKFQLISKNTFLLIGILNGRFFNSIVLLCKSKLTLSSFLHTDVLIVYSLFNCLDNILFI